MERQLVVKGVATPAMHATAVIDLSEDGAVRVWAQEVDWGVDCCIDVGAGAATFRRMAIT